MESSPNRSELGAFGLPGKYVASQEIFQQETDLIFSAHWNCVGHVSSLGNSGLMPIEFEGQKLLVALDGANVRVFRNFCRHRGSQLVTPENCQSLGQRIQCPYHAWTYQRDGKLVAAPNMEDVEGFNADDFGLIEVPSEVVGGFIWIHLSVPESAKLTAQQFLAPIANQFKGWSMDELVVVKSICYQVNANWKLIFQNYNECYHCPTVHPILNRLTPYKDADNEFLAGPILGGPMQLSNGTETMSMDGALVGEPLPNLSDRQRREVNYYTVFPSMFLSTHPDYVLVHRIKRLSMNTTSVVCDFLFHGDVVREGFDPSRAVEFWDMTNRQDWEVCELAQAGMHDPGYTPGPYSNLESVVAAFDAHYLASLELRTQNVTSVSDGR